MHPSAPLGRESWGDCFPGLRSCLASPWAVTVNAFGVGMSFRADAVGVEMWSVPWTGAMNGVSSIPNIFFIISDVIFFQQPPVFVLKRNGAVMFLLPGDVLNDGLLVPGTHRKNSISRLPMKSRKMRRFPVNPFGRPGFNFFHHVCHGDGAWEGK